MNLFSSITARQRFAKRCAQNRHKLFRIARSWGCDTDLANELVQESLAIALQKSAQLRRESALKSWLISILSNCHRGHHRRAGRTRELGDVELYSDHEPERELDQQRTVERVRIAIGLLGDDHRKVLTLVDMEGMSYLEVAQALDLRIGTVMSRLSRARARLRILLHDDLHENGDQEQRPPLSQKIRRLR